MSTGPSPGWPTRACRSTVSATWSSRRLPPGSCRQRAAEPFGSATVTNGLGGLGQVGRQVGPRRVPWLRLQAPVDGGVELAPCLLHPPESGAEKGEGTPPREVVVAPPSLAAVIEHLVALMLVAVGQGGPEADPPRVDRVVVACGHRRRRGRRDVGPQLLGQ